MLKFPRWKAASVFALALLLAFGAGVSAEAQEGGEGVKETRAAESGDDSPGLLHKVILYIPNRVFDIVDAFRLRLRAGPGVAAGVRATELADVYLGAYVSIFAGLPGPRMRPRLPMPVGLESFNGAEVSVADATLEGGIGPKYGPTEFGLSLHFLILGIDFGIDPVEILDFGVGLLTFDIRDDDF